MNKAEFTEAINNLAHMTASEKKIAAYFIEHFMSLPYARINDLCREIGVGKATLGRFLDNLGFSGVIEFKKALAKELPLHKQSPLQRLGKSHSQKESNNEAINQWHQHIAIAEQQLKQTSLLIESQALNKAVDYLSSPNGKLYVIGGATAHSLALYFTLLGRYLKKEIVLLDADISTLPHRLADSTQDDVLLAISYYRFSRVTVKLVRWFYQQRGATVVITDRLTNPFSTCSSALLVVDSQGLGLFNSRCSGFVLLEALIHIIASKQGPALESKLQLMEELFEELNVFSK